VELEGVTEQNIVAIISPLFCKKGLTAALSEIEFSVANRSTNGPLFYINRRQLHLQE
jgi:hypothetical protein